MYACISSAIGLIIGLFYAVAFGSIFAAINNAASAPINLGFLGLFFGVAAIVVVPIISFIAGLIMGLIIAALYTFLRLESVESRFASKKKVDKRCHNFSPFSFLL
jgi:hypothetical protein